MSPILRPFVPFLLLLLLVLAGCIGAPPEKVRVFWPPLPNEPHVEWLGTYASQHSFEKTVGQKRKEAILGQEASYRFARPAGIAGDTKRGLVYVSDNLLKNIRVFDFNQKTVSFLTKEPPGGTPYGLALDAAGNLYMGNIDNGSVTVFDPQGQVLRRFAGQGLEKTGFLAINDRLGRIYISDGKTHQVAVHTLDGAHLFNFGTPGGGESGLYGPQGLAIDREDRVFIADQWNARIQVFDADGNPLYRFGKRGTQPWDFEGPRDLAFDSEGNLWIIDGRKQTFGIFNPEGQMLLSFAPGSQSSQTPFSFGFPSSIFIDANDRVYIADALKLRFQVWQYLSESYLAQHPITEEERQKQLELLKGRGKK